MIVPLSDALAWIVDFIVTFSILLIMMMFYGIYPTLKMLYIPFYVFFIFITTMSVSLWTASIAVKFRDIRFIVEYGLRIFMFVTPVTYTAAKLESAFKPSGVRAPTATM